MSSVPRRTNLRMEKRSDVAKPAVTRLEKLLPLVCFVVSMLLLEYAWGSRFYSSATHVGHDFAGLAPGLLEGKFWIDSNGVIAGLLNPPWFTPAFCAGAAFYADPQSIFYSPIQLLALAVDPFRATHLSMLGWAVVAYWGGFVLARRIFGWSTTGATIFAVLGVANAFVPLRSAVGQAGYHPFYLWTLLTIALCTRVGGAAWRAQLWPSLSVGLILTAWLQFGFAGMMVPAFLATLILCFALVLVDKANVWLIVARSACGTIVALMLNASKLYESVSLMRNFPRSFYELPGFPSLTDSLLAIIYSLFLPSEWTAQFAAKRLVNVRFTALPHEWATQFGLGALLLALICAIALALFGKNRSERRELIVWHTREKYVAIAAIVALAAIPLLLMWNNATVREAFKQIPILNSAAWPMRWVVLLIPVTQFAIALVADRSLSLAAKRYRPIVILASIMLVWSGPLFEPLAYYFDREIQSYSPIAARDAFVRSTRELIPIASVVVAPDGISRLERNDAMFTGASESLCYNPLYGYRLEMLPHRNRIREGPSLAVDDDGMSLINNPACLVHPKASQCNIGSGFRMASNEDRSTASNFVNRKPFHWERPALGKALSILSMLCWLALAAGLAIHALLALKKMRA
jgi:hypothetical protein